MSLSRAPAGLTGSGPSFAYRDGMLHCGDVSLAEVAGAVGTPCFAYDLDAVVGAYRSLDQAFGEQPHLVCYSAKANESLAVLAALGRAGAGIEVVSGGELFKALRAGTPAERIIFGGVGKQAHEIAEAVQAGVLLISVESVAELERISEVARALGRRAPIALRVNPDVDAKTHPYIATGLREHKFGVPWAEAPDAYAVARALPGLDVVGLACHIGSQITDPAPFADAAARIARLARSFAHDGIALRILDLGGGLGIRYHDEPSLSPQVYVRALVEGLARGSDGDQQWLAGLRVAVEPGRAIVAHAGVLLTRVVYVKRMGDKTFVICDAGMTELLRPALYGAWHEIVPVRAPAAAAPTQPCEIVGPICESGDFLAHDRELVVPEPGDLLAVLGVGAYASVMSSRYNARPACAEVVVKGGLFAVSRRREQYEDLVHNELLPDILG